MKPTPSLQELFDRVYVHLLSQNEPAKAWAPSVCNELCRYRGDRGRKCAIGVLIPDNLYIQQMEQETISDTFRRIGWECPQGLERALRRLQIIHDETSPTHWNYLLKRFAEDHGLIFTDLEPAYAARRALRQKYIKKIGTTLGL